MQRIFVDSNFFLQCHNISNLNWTDISAHTDIELLIPRAVQKEIDKLKQDGNSRRAKRARATNTMFRRILASDIGQIVIRDRNPKVSITFSPNHPPAKHLPHGVFLDHSSLDDSIILELLSYRELFPDRDVGILTDDTNLQLTAKRANLAFIAIPDGWQLKPQPDERDKIINQLQAELRELKYKSPIIEKSILVRNKTIDEITYEAFECSELSESQLDKLIQDIKESHPIKTTFDESPDLHKYWPTGSIGNRFQKYVPPSDSEITEYQEKLYPRWIDEVRESLENLPKALESHHNRLTVSIKLRNIGGVPANNLLACFSVTDGLWVQAIDSESSNENQELWKPPAPPSPPEGSYQSALLPDNFAKNFLLSDRFGTRDQISSLLSSFDLSKQIEGIDNNQFYWKPSTTSPTTSLQISCGEFLHKIHEETILLEILLDPLRKPNGGSFSLIISASNMPKPIENALPIRVMYKKVDTYIKARYLCGL